MLEYVAISAFTVLMSITASYAMLKRGLSDEVILHKLDVITAECLQNEEFQKRIYSFGALVGKGLVDGSGLKGKASGKRGLEGLVMEIIGNYIGSRMAPQSSNVEQPRLGF